MSQQNEIDRLREQVKRYRFDYLTGMKMRIDFQHEVKAKFRAAKDSGVPFYLVMYDIDGLHEVNKDGHARGDALILEVAYDITAIPHACCSYRVGGDEFMVVHNEEPKDYQVENATGTYVRSDRYGKFCEMSEAVDQKLMGVKAGKSKRSTDI